MPEQNKYRIVHGNSIPNDLFTRWRKEDKRIVFTNGCFDILHRGHVHYLEEASNLGDKLVVGLNSDASVKRLKGEGRPVKNELNRSEVLAALRSVDLVIIFEEDTPLNIIKKVIPDILVKGGDWPLENIIGAEFVLNNGGEVKTLSYIEGESSTSLIQAMKKNNQI